MCTAGSGGADRDNRDFKPEYRGLCVCHPDAHHQGQIHVRNMKCEEQIRARVQMKTGDAVYTAGTKLLSILISLKIVNEQCKDKTLKTLK